MFRRVALADRTFTTFCTNVVSRKIESIIGQRRPIAKITGKRMDRPKVYVTRRIPQSGLELLAARCEVTQWDSDDPVPLDQLVRNVKGVDALFCLLTDAINKEVLDAAGERLKVVSTMSVGYDHIDVAECARRNLPIGYTPDVLTDATAELTVALLLATARRIPEGVQAVRSGAWGTWKPLWLCGPGLLHSTVGIVGFGRIGQAVARRLVPFGVSRVVYSGRTAHPEAAKAIGGADHVPFDTLLAESDFVIVCCALTAETQELFNKQTFPKMKPSAILVNTSRGGVVDQEALYEALTKRQILAAGLDVTTPEPLATNHPLLTLDNCLVLPHIGSATNQARSLMAQLAANNILAVLDKKPMPAQLKV